MTTHSAWDGILERQPQSIRDQFHQQLTPGANGCVFIRDVLTKYPNWLLPLLNSGPELAQELTNDFIGHIENVTEEATLMQVIRKFRMWHMLRIAWHDLNGRFELSVVMQELSQLADVILAETAKKLMSWQVEQLGVPQDDQQHPQPFIIIALGKLGSKELNFSSDVDLMFAYPRAGKTTTGIPCEQFFTKLAQRLIYVLQTPTEDGFVFRVDMRLRPYGDAGALVMNFSQLAVYYQEQGRQWERYALVKARCIKTEKHWVAEWNRLLKPFVYRRYVDYGSIESLREMKQLIEREVTVKNLQNDIKRGPGGIRQIEFIGQVFQLIRGGSLRRLQQRKILPVLRYLKRADMLAVTTVNELIAAYTFLRKVEHRLQMMHDQQTHTLPQDPAIQLWLANSMNFDDWSSFYVYLQQHQHNVRHHFENMLQPATTPATQVNFQPQFVNFWQNQLNDVDACAWLQAMGISQPEAILAALIDFRDSHRCRQLQADAKQRLSIVMPNLLLQVAMVQEQLPTFIRVIHLLEAIVRRSAYLALLIENPEALTRLVQLFAKSAWIADKITSSPFLLDELTRQEKLTKPIFENKLADQLRQILLGIPEQEFEEQRESVRVFKSQCELRTAIAEVEGTMPLMKVSDQLSFTAGVILASSRDITVKELSEKKGELQQFAIIAYGKLGGLEMSYLSDLDLVFLHDMGLNTDAPIRLAQRIIHMQTTRTTNGVLYQVDTRLRPSGTAGLLVSSVDAFVRYQTSEAWLWEHQALIRARFICGDSNIEARFNQARSTILTQARDVEFVRQEVCAMREKMRAQQSSHSQLFDIKNERGGITDIEFLAHFGALVHAHAHPQVVRWTDTIRILEELGDVGCFPTTLSDKLIQIYQEYRAYLHQRILKGITHDPTPVFAEERAFVAEAWRRLLVA